MITGKPVALEGAHLTPAQVKKFVDNIRAQLRTKTLHNSQMETIIDEKAWGTIKMKIANSRTLRDNPAQDWRCEWNVDVFFEAFEEVFAVTDSDRFASNFNIWTTWTQDLRYKLVVDPENLGKLSKMFTEAIIDLEVEHPMPSEKKHRLLENIAHSFIASGNLGSKERANIQFNAEITDKMKHDAVYRREATVEKFVEICDTVIVRWQKEAFEVRQRGVKRKESNPIEGAQTKKPRCSC